MADDAALEAARSYRRLWRKPQLDPTYGITALASYNTLIGLYPTSPLVPAAQKEIAELQNWFAIKDYDSGLYYFREKAYDSGIIYFKDVITKYANTPTARDAGLRLVEAYKAIHYTGDAQDMCASLKQSYPKDRSVERTCAGIPEPSATAKADTAKPPLTPVPPAAAPRGR
jgi:outer membrane assembly lipoprotein YfiO